MSEDNVGTLEAIPGLDDDNEVPPFAPEAQKQEPAKVEQVSEEQPKKKPRKKRAKKKDESEKETLTYAQAKKKIDMCKEQVEFYGEQIEAAKKAKRDDVIEAFKTAQRFLYEQAEWYAKELFDLNLD